MVDMDSGWSRVRVVENGGDGGGEVEMEVMEVMGGG